MYPTSIPALRRAIRDDPAFEDWSFRDNPPMTDPDSGEQIGGGTFSIWTTPEGEDLVVSPINVTLTSSDRPRPQVRVDTDKAKRAYAYARREKQRFFFLAYCTNPGLDWKFRAGLNLSHYIVSLESPLDGRTGGRVDIRSMYDALETRDGQDFFRVTENQHSCSSLRQGAFISLAGENGDFDPARLRDYLLYFDSRPYQKDLGAGRRPVYVPSALYETPDPEPLALPWNLLVHGAPGTGKSHFLEEKAREFQAQYASVEVRRVTFYEDCSYGQFVGQYMPVPVEDARRLVELETPGGPVSGGVTGSQITYRFVPGPLAELLAGSLAAKLNGDGGKFVLIVEELNRANAAGVFGDVFQLLDRERGVSVYEITPQAELAEYLYDAVVTLLGPESPLPPPEAFRRLRLPDNLYIWATMNSADQGVFPLDSAFKRRWDYIYRDICDVDPAAANRSWICLPVLEEATGRFTPTRLDWNAFRTAINRQILTAGFAEDRCLGYWFFSAEELEAVEAYTTAAAENRNGEGARDLSQLPNPLVDKLFASLMQDVFRNMPAGLFAEGVTGLSQVRQALKRLELEGEPAGIKRLLRLPPAAYVPAPPEEA